MSSIEQWLRGNRNYNIGVALYNAYGNDERLAEMFAQGYSLYRHTRLVQELESIRKKIIDQSAGKAGTPIAPVPAANPEPQYQKVQHGKEQMPELKVAPEKDPYRKEWLPLYIEMQNLCARLADMTDEITRGKAAHHILSLELRCIEIWQRRDYFVATGKHMPPPSESIIEPVTDPNLLFRKLNNIRCNISKRKKALAADPDDTKSERLLQKYQVEKDLIIQQLKALNLIEND